MKIDFEKRIDKNIIVEESLYILGFVDIIEFLVGELKVFLKEENRFFGLAKSYVDCIENAIYNISKESSEEDVEIFGKILYLYKPLIISEFKRLKEKKKLSSGDSVICLIKKIVDIITEKEPNKKGIRTIKKIIYKFFDNIKNKSKLDPLYFFSNTIKTYLSKGIIGNFESNSLSLTKFEEKKEVFNGDNIKLEEINENSITEITWIGEN